MDLGTHTLGDPASVWQLEAVRELESQGYKRTAFHQCGIDACGHAKPTGVLTDIPDWGGLKAVHAGWPDLETKNDKDGIQRVRYLGPLPSNCGHREHARQDMKLTRVLMGPAIVDDVMRRREADTPTDGDLKKHGETDVARAPSGTALNPTVQSETDKSSADQRIKGPVQSSTVVSLSSEF